MLQPLSALVRSLVTCWLTVLSESLPSELGKHSETIVKADEKFPDIVLRLLIEVVTSSAALFIVAVDALHVLPLPLPSFEGSELKLV